MSDEPSDEELLLTGGVQGFGVLYERRHPLVRGYLRHRVGPRPDLVLDLVAETFARALERREQFDAQRGTAIGWLLGIANHLFLDAVRRGRVVDEAREGRGGVGGATSGDHAAYRDEREPKNGGCKQPHTVRIGSARGSLQLGVRVSGLLLVPITAAGSGRRSRDHRLQSRSCQTWARPSRRALWPDSLTAERWAVGSGRVNFRTSATRRLLTAPATGAFRLRSAVATSARRSSVGCEASVSGGEGATMMSMNRGRYRLRTWLRGRLPVALADLVPKGACDCGAHEWYRADQQTWRCYHCEPAVARSSPWSSEEHLQHTLGGIDSTLRVLALRGEPGGEEELAELHRLVREALAALPEEEHRLERLAAAPAAELPGLVQALHAG